MTATARRADEFAALVTEAVREAVRDEVVQRPAVRLYTVPKVAELLSVSVRTVENLTASGRLPSVVVGERSRRVRSDHLDEYIAALPPGGAS